MAIPTKELPKSRGRGLDFRTAPEKGGPPPSGGDDAVVNRLSEMAQEAFGVKGAESEKKKSAGEPQSRGGTIPSGNTGSSSPAAVFDPSARSFRPAGPNAPGGSPAPTFREDVIPAGQVDQRTEKGGEDATHDSAGTAAPGSGVEEVASEAAPETLDALALLNKGLQQPKALDQKEESGAKDKAQESSEESKPKSEGSALRSQLEKTIAENKELARKLSEREKQEDPRIKEVTTAWEQEKKAREELEAKIAHLDYSQSREFKERFVEPYENAAKDTLKQLRGMVTNDGAKLTQDELETIMVGGEEAAYQVIDEKFSGAKATMATGWVKDIYSLDRVRYRALESAKQMAVQRQEQARSQSQAEAQQVKLMWEKERDNRMAAAKDLFERPTGDKKRSQLLDEGAVLADAAFLHPPNATKEQLIAIKAEVRNHAAALPALVEERNRWKAKAEEFEARLAKYERHTPGNGEPGEESGQRKSQHQEGTMEFAIEQLRELAS